MSMDEAERFPASATAFNLNLLPKLGHQIKELLTAKEWEEVNQGLELLVASIGNKEIETLTRLIDARALRVIEPDHWKATLGISLRHEVNAVAKIAELSGILSQLRSIRLYSSTFANEIEIDLSLLSSASALEELIINGASISGLGGLSNLIGLQKLALITINSIEWDPEEHGDVFTALTDLRFLALSQWPWEDLQPLTSLRRLESLDLRNGLLRSLRGLDQLKGITNLSISDCSVSSIDEIGSLADLATIYLSEIDIHSLEPLAGLEKVTSVELYTSEPVDIAAFGSLPRLESVRLLGGRIDGLGALAMCANIRSIILNEYPEYCYGETPDKRFKGNIELDRLFRCWKSVSISRSRISCVATKGGDIPVLLLGVSVMETLTGTIDADEFRIRCKHLFTNWGEELRSRAYWPRRGENKNTYPNTHPVGNWLHRASGSVPEATLESIASILADYLPSVPQRH